MESQTIDQSQPASSVAYRPVGADDGVFLLDLYAGTRGDEMALVPWTEEQQRAFVKMQYAAQQEHYREKYPVASHEIILSNGRPVGHRYVARLEREIRIVDITVIASERNRGIGTFSLRELLDEAKEAGTVVTIYVETFNPSLHLFERLGFRQIAEHGAHLLMEWAPTT
jgi:RimJ/RimL family protein N-acetyltransferase